MGRHRGAKLRRRYELLGEISLLSLRYLLSVERRQFHILPPDHLGLLSYLLGLLALQLSKLIPLRNQRDFHPRLAYLGERLRYILGGNRPS